MKTYLQISLAIFIVTQLGACTMGQLTVRASMPMIEGGIIAMNQQSDLELAEAALPANISLIEGMIVNDPGNEELRLYAAQAYYGYGFGFIEDGFMKNGLAVKANPKRAAALYDKGFSHAKQLLADHGITDKMLNGELNDLQQRIDKLGKSAVPALFWAASCWAKSIDLNRDKARNLAQLPKAVMLMQRVLELDENYYMSGAHVFFGVYYGSKSPMLGGNFALSEQHFAAANKATQNKLLIINLLQAQYLERQRFNQQAFHDLLTQIQQADDALYPEQALINQISKYKASLLLNKEEQWF
ncbi:TRAP transporter TatT component family protein [sulfur-oxidizing endosymbiont of Gigantopelta aegis]|uniref:TRAP transporter TatT component family protein n=1 Tax=sulfur-oxidizing endosymbiont of Gigantopelta aegis TaxID=2794934 RepID=UPI0018DDCED9|nr:TRAP transporter TatT component family protein [sulfur-oxidizing endosymbiont of Gigantopelta aegis]